jgi:hypothetical protein
MIERVFVFATGLVGWNDQQLRRLMHLAKGGPDGHRHAGLQLDLSGPELVTEGLEQGGVELLVGLQALGVFAQAGERRECGKPLAAESGEAFVRRPAIGTAFGTGFRSGFAAASDCAAASSAACQLSIRARMSPLKTSAR